jgi:hypothetical protein
MGSSALKYNLLSDAIDGGGVVPMDDKLQTLMDAAFEQIDDGKIKTSVLTFKQKLDDVGPAAAISDETRWLFAIGLPDNQWEGKHNVQGSFSLRLEDNCMRMNIQAPEVVTDVEDTNPTPPADDEEQVLPPVEQEPEPEGPHDADPEESSIGNADDVQDTDSKPEHQQPVTSDDNADAGSTGGAAEEPVAVINQVCSFGEAREIYMGKLKLEHYKNTAAGTYSMRLTYMKGSAWVSIG